MMTTGWWKGIGFGLALGAGSALLATPASAQVNGRDECRCVDADGNEIENCSCIVLPDFEDFDLDGIQDFDVDVAPFMVLRDALGNMTSARPRLGISVDVRQPADADSRGARVEDVMTDGPAEGAGLRAGDVVTAIDGRSLLDPLPDADEESDLDPDRSLPVQRMLALVRNVEPGDDVAIAFERDGSSQTVTLQAEDLGQAWGAMIGRRARAQAMQGLDQAREAMARSRREMRSSRDALALARPNPDRIVLGLDGMRRYGLRLMALTPGLGDYFGVEDGVLVTDVDEGSALGLEPGDVIVRIGDREATSPERVRRILGSYGDAEEILFDVRRDGRDIEVLGRLEG